MVTYDDIKKQFGRYKDKKLTRGKAIKLYCKELCSAGDYQSWANCEQVYCPLWRFRKGSEIKVNSGSFGVRGKITPKKEKDVLKQGNTKVLTANKGIGGLN